MVTNVVFWIINQNYIFIELHCRIYWTIDSNSRSQNIFTSLTQWKLYFYQICKTVNFKLNTFKNNFTISFFICFDYLKCNFMLNFLNIIHWLFFYTHFKFNILIFVLFFCILNAFWYLFCLSLDSIVFNG